jgi:hypothetical protein
MPPTGTLADVVDRHTLLLVIIAWALLVALAGGQAPYGLVGVARKPIALRNAVSAR